jgi:hypothetical protein
MNENVNPGDNNSVPALPGSKADHLKILPRHFFSREDEKTKFNWFAFELALELKVSIPGKLRKYLEKKKYPEPELNRACVRLAKLLQAAVLRKLRKEAPEMRIDYTDVEKAFPGLQDKTVNDLLTCAGAAWDHLLEQCCVCPSACVSNKDDYCTMFDDSFYSK